MVIFLRVNHVWLVAGQTLARKLMLSLVDKAQHNQPLSVDPKFVNGLRSLLCNSSLDKGNHWRGNSVME